jgi:hypothetical protein
MIQQRLKLVSSPRFDKIARQLCEIPERDESSDEEHTGESIKAKRELTFDDDYWEVSSTDSHLEDDSDVEKEEAASATRKGEELARRPAGGADAAGESKQKLRLTPPPALTKSHVTKFRRLCSIQEAFKKKKGHHSVIRDDKEYDFAYPRLECEQCCFSGGHLVSVGNDEYMRDCANTDRWYDTDFISSFAALVAHEAHNPAIQLIHCQNPLSQLGEDECRELSDSVETIVSVLHAHSHYAVLEADIPERKITILDGLLRPLEHWQAHAMNILRRCKLIPMGSAPKFVTNRKGKIAIQVDGEKWTMEKDIFICQNDAWNCGPIACLKILAVFQHPSDVSTIAANQYRLTVMKKFQDLLCKFGHCLNVSIPVVEIEICDDGSDSDESQCECCAVCCSPLSKSCGLKVATTSCCKQRIHSRCLSEWLDFNASCLFCRAELDYVNLVSPTKAQDSAKGVVFSPAKEEDGKLLLAMKKSSDSSDSDAKTPLRLSDTVRRKASSKKRLRQQEQAERMKKQRRDAAAASGIKVGSIVTLKVDYRDVSHPRGIVGVVADVSSSDAGGVRVVTEWGVVATGASRSVYWVPSDRYVVRPDDAVVSDNLQRIREDIVSGITDWTSYPRVTLQQAHANMVGHSPGGKRRCSCRKQCGPRCGCIKGKVSCNSSCACSGNCRNPNNNS